MKIMMNNSIRSIESSEVVCLLNAQTEDVNMIHKNDVLHQNYEMVNL